MQIYRKSLFISFKENKNLKRLCLLAAYLIIVFAVSRVVISWHEIWNDEAQAWLIVKNLSFSGVVHQLQYEGSPGLWHFMLFPLAHAGLRYTSMIYVNVAFCIAAAFLMYLKAPFSKGLRIAFILSWPMIYGYLFISRNYAITTFFVFLVAWLWKDRFSKPWLYILTLILLGYSNGLTIAMAGLLFWHWLYEIWKKNSFKLLKYPIFLGVLGFVFTALQIMPNGDRYQTTVNYWQLGMFILASISALFIILKLYNKKIGNFKDSVISCFCSIVVININILFLPFGIKIWLDSTKQLNKLKVIPRAGRILCFFLFFFGLFVFYITSKNLIKLFAWQISFPLSVLTDGLAIPIISGLALVSIATALCIVYYELAKNRAELKALPSIFLLSLLWVEIVMYFFYPWPAAMRHLWIMVIILVGFYWISQSSQNNRMLLRKEIPLAFFLLISSFIGIQSIFYDYNSSYSQSKDAASIINKYPQDTYLIADSPYASSIIPYLYQTRKIYYLNINAEGSFGVWKASKDFLSIDDCKTIKNKIDKLNKEKFIYIEHIRECDNLKLRLIYSSNSPTIIDTYRVYIKNNN